jgi:hypothetical protein
MEPKETAEQTEPPGNIEQQGSIDTPVNSEQQGKKVAPRNPSQMSEYIIATQGLFEQVSRENPGQELHAIRLVAVKGKYKKYLVPIEIEVVPKE